MKDPIKRADYMKRYRDSGRKALSEAKRFERMKTGRCLCGNPGVKVKDKQSVCATCDRIETDLARWEDAKLRDVGLCRA